MQRHRHLKFDDDRLHFGPGVVKSVLTLRTGNAWAYAWAYHALAPHVTLDTTNIVNIFRLR